MEKIMILDSIFPQDNYKEFELIREDELYFYYNRNGKESCISKRAAKKV